MAKKTVLVSDLSGSEITDDKDGALIIIRYNDARRGEVLLDAHAAEVDTWAEKGRKQARKGRKPAVV